MSFRDCLLIDQVVKTCAYLSIHRNHSICNNVMDEQITFKQGSKYRISGSYRMGVFHIGYCISEEISGIRAHIGRSYQTLYIMKYW